MTEKQKLFKLKHSRKYKDEQVPKQDTSDGPSRGQNMSTEFDVNPRLEANYENLEKEKVDCQVSAQQSLIDVNQSYYQETKPPKNVTIVSQSSDHVATLVSNLGINMHKKRPIYSGEIESRMDLPQSSINVLNSNDMNEYNIIPGLQYGATIRTPTDAGSELRVESRAASNVAHDETMIANLTQTSFKTQQNITLLDNGNKSSQLNLVQGKRNANQMVTDQNKVSKNPP